MYTLYQNVYAIYQNVVYVLYTFNIHNFLMEIEVFFNLRKNKIQWVKRRHLSLHLKADMHLVFYFYPGSQFRLRIFSWVKDLSVCPQATFAEMIPLLRIPNPASWLHSLGTWKRANLPPNIAFKTLNSAFKPAWSYPQADTVKTSGNQCH